MNNFAAFFILLAWLLWTKTEQDEMNKKIDGLIEKDTCEISYYQEIGKDGEVITSEPSVCLCRENPECCTEEEEKK